MEENKQYLETIPDIKSAFEDDEDSNSFNSPKKDSKSKTPVLDTYSRDLTKMAEDGKLDPIVGREKEIERVSQILSRRKKNNPILIGEPGCVDGSTIINVRKISEEGKHKIIIK
jgi:ATP-dependent Clp protease ATP-binding subunit ClpC